LAFKSAAALRERNTYQSLKAGRIRARQRIGRNRESASKKAERLLREFRRLGSCGVDEDREKEWAT
jgi:hypothetical protein